MNVKRSTFEGQGIPCLWLQWGVICCREVVLRIKAVCEDQIVVGAAVVNVRESTGPCHLMKKRTPYCQDSSAIKLWCLESLISRAWSKRRDATGLLTTELEDSLSCICIQPLHPQCSTPAPRYTMRPTQSDALAQDILSSGIGIPKLMLGYMEGSPHKFKPALSR